MVCKELKMNFNAAFVHNYPVVHTCFIGSFFSLLPSSSNISQSRLETFLVLPSFFREERIKDFVTKKRFSLLLERRRITWRLTACLIVNRGTGALTANALTANLQKNTRNMESIFFFSLMALSNTGMGCTVAFSASLHRHSRMCWDIKHFLSYWGLTQEPLGKCTEVDFHYSITPSSGFD